MTTLVGIILFLVFAGAAVALVKLGVVIYHWVAGKNDRGESTSYGLEQSQAADEPTRASTRPPASSNGM